MIPISSNKFLEHVEDEVTWKLRYLTGDRADEFNALQHDSMRSRSAFLAKAKDVIAEKTKGQKLKKGELESLILAEATRLASESVESDPAADYRYARALVDIFVAGWDGKDVAPLGDKERPSARLLYSDILKLSNVVSKHLGELIGLEREAIKNS
jgi:hypothetical protein